MLEAEPFACRMSKQLGPRAGLLRPRAWPQGRRRPRRTASVAALLQDPAKAARPVSPVVELLAAAQPWPRDGSLPPNLHGGTAFLRPQSLSTASGANTFVKCPANATPHLPPDPGRSLSDVAIYLHQQGLDTDELEEAHPEAFAQLTLPLAKVLAEAHAACAADWKGENSWCARPSELMRRICTLHSEVGLSAADISELWRQQPYFFKFQVGGVQQTMKVMAGVVAWLSGPSVGLSREELSRCWRQQLSMFAIPATSLGRHLASLCAKCPLTAEQQRAFIINKGALLATTFSEFLAKLESLMAAAPGIQAHLAALLSSDAGAEEVLGELDRLMQTAHYLRRYGFSREQMRSVQANEPAALAPDLRGSVRPALEGLEARLGGKEAAIAAVCSQPTLLAAAREPDAKPHTSKQAAQ